MSEFTAELRSLAVGSLPHTDPADACQLVWKYWTSRPGPSSPRSFLENMYVQFSERFPVWWSTTSASMWTGSEDLDPGLEQLYVAYLMDDLEYAAISVEYAAGLHHFLAWIWASQPASKGRSPVR